MPNIKGVSEASFVAIGAFFDTPSSGLFTRRTFEHVVSENRKAWKLPVSLSAGKLLSALLEQGLLQKTELKFPSRKEVRYSRKRPGLYQLALSIRANAYLTHHTAMQLHGLSAQKHDSIYVNVEQTEKPQWRDELDQEAIERAFKRPPRTTTNIARLGRHTICLLSGKHSGMLGVQPLTTKRDADVRYDKEWRIYYPSFLDQS